VANAKAPEDHKPAATAAAKAEAAGDPQPVSFEFDGETYTIDADAADDLELMEYIEGEKYILALKGYLGAEQWQRFKDTHRNDKGRVTASRAGDFLQALTEAIGAGNS
jgi:hypothetical protein